jgi:hypothetical protein
MGEMKEVPNERKREFGQVMNAFKLLAEEKYETLKAAWKLRAMMLLWKAWIGRCPATPCPLAAGTR